MKPQAATVVVSTAMRMSGARLCVWFFLGAQMGLARAQAPVLPEQKSSVSPLAFGLGFWQPNGRAWQSLDRSDQSAVPGGPEAALRYSFTRRLDLSAGAGWFNGGAPFAGLDGMYPGLGIDQYSAEVGYGITHSLRLSLGAELVDWGFGNSPTMFGGSRSFSQWYDVGIGYSLAQNARLSFLWLFSNTSPSTPAALPISGSGRTSNNLISTQISIKF